MSLRLRIVEEEVKACIALRPPGTPETRPPQELWAFCSKHLAAFKVPRYLEYRDSLPKTPSSKVQKQVLRNEAGNTAKIVIDRLDMAKR